MKQYLAVRRMSMRTDAIVRKAVEGKAISESLARRLHQPATQICCRRPKGGVRL